MLKNYSTSKKEIDYFKFGFNLSKMSLNIFLNINSFKANFKICNLKFGISKQSTWGNKNRCFFLSVPSSSSGFWRMFPEFARPWTKTDFSLATLTPGSSGTWRAAPPARTITWQTSPTLQGQCSWTCRWGGTSLNDFTLSEKKGW